MMDNQHKKEKTNSLFKQTIGKARTVRFFALSLFTDKGIIMGF